MYNTSLFLLWNLRNYLWASCQTNMFPKHYSRTSVTWLTLKRNKKQFEWAGNFSYWGKFQWNFDQGKGNIVWLSGEFEWSEFELSRFYCTSDVTNNRKWTLKNCYANKFSKTTMQSISVPFFIGMFTLVHPRLLFVFAVLFIPSFDVLSMGLFSCFTQFGGNSD